MPPELPLHSFTHHQNQSQSHPNQLHQNPSSICPPAWMWNPKTQQEEEDDSWEVRAFAEDTGNAMGTTWPPRSYTCTFCRREFRSAQALGGHMNVHRRDRARLHHSPNQPASSSNGSSALIIPSREFISKGGLCMLYQLPNSNPNLSGVFVTEPPSTLLSMSPFLNCSVEPSDYKDEDVERVNDNNASTGVEELDLELRLGQR